MSRWALALCVIALTGCGETGSAVKSSQRLEGGGERAFKARLAALKGTPVVVNQWASWCGPCRSEFAFLATAAKRYSGRVAFLGVDAKDSRSDAEAFLSERPLPYPNFFDPDLDISRTFDGGRAWPTTAFYGKDGRVVHTRFGAYKDVAQLDAEIRKYALDG